MIHSPQDPTRCPIIILHFTMASTESYLGEEAVQALYSVAACHPWEIAVQPEGLHYVDRRFLSWYQVYLSSRLGLLIVTVGQTA